MKRKATLRDIARELQLTVSGVSKALSNHPGISPATKKKVREVAARLDYRPNKVAASLQSGQTKIIGVIIPSADKSFFGSIVYGMENVINENGYNVLLYQSHELPDKESKGIETFIQSDVDGIIATLGKQTTRYEHYLDIIRRNIPLILFDTTDDRIQAPSVTIDNVKGGFLATEHLILNGYRDIAHISGPEHISIFKDRLQGYIRALQKYNLPVDESLIVHGKNTIESGAECMDHLLRCSKQPGALVAVEDFTALGAIKLLKRRGIRIPAEMGVVGFSNEGFSEHITPSLTTINQQTTKMGEEAAKLFFKLHKATGIRSSEPEKVILEPELIIRESSVRC